MNQTLNAEQLLAVNHVDGPCVVSACPGSGKTKVVTHRAATLIKNGVDPYSILLITFTNKAAKEMKSRLTKLCLDNDISGSEGVTISTFHALCANFLRQGLFPNTVDRNFSILDEDEAVNLITDCGEESGIDRSESKSLLYAYSSWRETESGWMNENIEDAFPDPKHLDTIKCYEHALRSNNAVDFSGLIKHVVFGLQVNPEIKKRISNRFKYVVVDEAQDTNDAQFQIAMDIASHGNLMIVGDADQAIYEWRGAKPDNMLNMQKNIADCRLIRLQTNYRSTASITNPASALISKNPNRLNETINPAKGDGAPVIVKVHRQRDEESSEICRKIKILAAQGIPLRKIAILFRANSQSRAFEMSLRHYNIPYKITGAFKFLDREEIKDILSMLKFAVNPSDSISFGRFSNKPKRGLGASAVATLAPRLSSKSIDDTLSRVSNDPAFPRKQRDALCDVLRAFHGINGNSDPGLVVSHLVAKLQYRTWIELSVKEKDKVNDKMDNIEELIRYAQSFSEQKQGNLQDFCTSLCLADDGSDEKEENSINLMSIHASKGLEFHTVFLVCCEDGSIPHERSIKDIDISKIEEERRLMYVAMTRAEERLVISMSLFDGRSRDQNNKLNVKKYSRFLDEAGIFDKQEFFSQIKSLQEFFH